MKEYKEQSARAPTHCTQLNDANAAWAMVNPNPNLLKLVNLVNLFPPGSLSRRPPFANYKANI